MPLTALQRGLPLFVECEPAGRVDDQFSLHVHGVSVESGTFRGVGLFVQCESGEGSIFNASLPLSVLGNPVHDITANMNLFVKGVGLPASSGLPLTLFNMQSGVTANATLFVSGEGTTENSVPLERGMGLFLQRMPSNACTLYLHGPGQSGTLPTTLFVNGAGFQSKSADLSIPSTVGYSTKSSSLYTHGF